MDPPDSKVDVNWNLCIFRLILKHGIGRGGWPLIFPFCLHFFPWAMLDQWDLGTSHPRPQGRGIVWAEATAPLPQGPRLTWKLPRPLWKTWFHSQRPSGSFHVSLRECLSRLPELCGLSPLARRRRGLRRRYAAGTGGAAVLSLQVPQQGEARDMGAIKNRDVLWGEGGEGEGAQISPK